VNYEEPKFSMGDLVVFSGAYVGDTVKDLGIIISEPTLVFVHEWSTKSDFPDQFWSYNVKVGNELFKMIPEQFLRGLAEK
tara:strand:- start:1101 stop:1340 length:240 start_codon:yes stop_codon:yes gene_type:complete